MQKRIAENAYLPMRYLWGSGYYGRTLVNEETWHKLCEADAEMKNLATMADIAIDSVDKVLLSIGEPLMVYLCQ